MKRSFTRLLRNIADLIDVKSLVTLGLTGTLIYVVVSGASVDEKVFLLMSNVTTMIYTYFFTKKKYETEAAPPANEEEV